MAGCKGVVDRPAGRCKPIGQPPTITLDHTTTTMGSPRTHKRRRQRADSRYRHSAEAREIARWNALSPLAKVLEVRSAAYRHRLMLAEVNEVCVRHITPGVIDRCFQSSGFAARLRSRHPLRP